MHSIKLKAIIIDDEIAALETLEYKINRYSDSAEIVATCQSAKEGLMAIQKHQPDLVFLDIEMPWMNGFEMLDCLGDQINFEVIFVTAYNQYAIQAFKVKAFDYLLKPVNKDELISCLDRLGDTPKKLERDRLVNLMQEMDQPVPSKKIILHTNNSLEIVEQDRILYLEADSNYCSVYTTNDQRTIVSKPLNSIEKYLDPTLFLRVHRSFSVNLKHVKRLITENGAFAVILNNEKSIPVSRRKKEALLKLIENI